MTLDIEWRSSDTCAYDGAAMFAPRITQVESSPRPRPKPVGLFDPTSVVVTPACMRAVYPVSCSEYFLGGRLNPTEHTSTPPRWREATGG